MNRSRTIRSQALRFLEQCERGLADAYRALPPRVLSTKDATRLALLHERHAALLADCIRRLGRRPSATAYDSWIGGRSLDAMQAAERLSFTAYRDHLTTFAPATARMIQERILQDHYSAMEMLAHRAAKRGTAAPDWLIHAPP